MSAQTLRRVLVPIVLALAAASFLAQLLKYPLDTPRGLGLVPLFDSDAEKNIPTIYSALALLGCAALLYLRGAAARRAAERYARHWLALAAIFLLAAVDEVVQLHERVNEQMASALGVSETALPWVAPGAVLVLVLAIAYREFVRHLPEPVRQRAILGGGVFAAGALGVELLEAASVAALEGDAGRFVDGVISTVQELCEMLGAVFILEALVLEMSLQARPVAQAR